MELGEQNQLCPRPILAHFRHFFSNIHASSEKSRVNQLKPFDHTQGKRLTGTVSRPKPLSVGALTKKYACFQPPKITPQNALSRMRPCETRGPRALGFKLTHITWLRWAVQSRLHIAEKPASIPSQHQYASGMLVLLSYFVP